MAEQRRSSRHSASHHRRTPRPPRPEERACITVSTCRHPGWGRAPRLACHRRGPASNERGTRDGPCGGKLGRPRRGPPRGQRPPAAPGAPRPAALIWGTPPKWRRRDGALDGCCGRCARYLSRTRRRDSHRRAGVSAATPPGSSAKTGEDGAQRLIGHRRVARRRARAPQPDGLGDHGIGRRPSVRRHRRVLQHLASRALIGGSALVATR